MIDVTLACEDNSSNDEVVTVADVDAEDRVGNSLLQRGWLLSLRWSKQGGESWFWHFRASDFHETFSRSSLALNISRKLLLNP